MTAIPAYTCLDHLQVSYYGTYEDREDAFARSAGNLVPCRYAGPERFWAEFREITGDRMERDAGSARTALITSNPRDCLAFGTPHQVLTGAALRTGAGMTASIVEVAADCYRLVRNLHQPLRTLSGGETVKLAMAKSSIAAVYSDKLCMASPFSWLSAANASLFDHMLEQYTRRSLPMELFALDGENSSEADRMANDLAAAIPPLTFGLRLEDAIVDLGGAVQVTGAPVTAAHFSDVDEILESPCFLYGDNGQGKSLLAKMLVGAVNASGDAMVSDPAPGARPRMMFQDVVGQVMSRSFAAMAANGWANGDTGLDRYRRLVDAFCRYADGLGPVDGESRPRLSPDSPSMLETKLLLAALRLNRSTSLLILDEPDWGVTRPDAFAFVLAVMDTAYMLGVPVLIISHKPWWSGFARSGIRVEKRYRETRGSSGEQRFDVVLSRTD